MSGSKKLNNKSNVITVNIQKDINSLLGSKAHLELWVKVKKDWTERPDALASLGYGKDSF